MTKTLKLISPVNGELYTERPVASREAVEGAVAKARAAQKAWAARPLAERVALVREGIARLRDMNDDVVPEIAWTMGRPVRYGGEIGGVEERAYHMADIAAEALAPMEIEDSAQARRMIRREPLGVVAAVIPWNSQMFLSAVKIAPALAAGNTIVLKASEEASTPLLAFGKLVAEAGIPDGVVNIVTGHGEPCGRALTSHPLVARVAFTGGPKAAAQVVRNTANNFAAVSLELGGKSPFIVFDDANLESAVNGSVAGIFGASGQSCVAGSRLFLQDGIADRFLDAMTRTARGIRIGDPMAEETEMGPLCTAAQVRHIRQQVDRAVEQGATLITGGNQPEGLGPQFFEPTIIEAPDPSLDIVDTELFGPVLTVQRFRDEEEALALANQSEHGLAAGIFTRDSARSLRMAKRIRAGIVWVNTYRAISPIAAFGGEKMSGYGREAGFQAMYDFTRPKTVWMNLSDEPLSSPFQPR